MKPENEVVAEGVFAEAYWRAKIAKEIEDAVIEVVGDSAATMKQAATIARGRK